MDNKTSKYFKYAIGEIMLVVIGILIALQINNWNENQKLIDKRESLISSLIEDFEYNTLENFQIISLFDSQLATMDNYFNIISNSEQTISVDSLRTMARAFFTWDLFIPKMTAYYEAESSGNLSLLDNKILLQEIAKFQQQYEFLIMYNEEGTHTFHNGSTWEFRKTVEPGTIYNSSYSGSTAKDIPYAEYKSIMQTPLAKNVLQNTNLIIGNSHRILIELYKHTKVIHEILIEMKKTN